MFKILVVEDDRELNKTVCTYLSQNGYEAHGCLSANEAYDAMYGGTLFDLIISDIMMPEVDGFEFAQTVRELNQEIPKKYLPKQEDKMEQLRRLDRSATKKGTAISILVGVIGCLLLGVGMCCTMVWMGAWFIPGVILGVVGIAGVAVAYPLYIRITKKEREKLAPQILKLTEELSKLE